MKAFRARSIRIATSYFAAITISLSLLLATLALPVRGQTAPVQSQGSPTPTATPKKSQEAVVAPNENLVVEGIPPIPASLAEQVNRYTNFRAAQFLSWHPTKREMLIATRFGDTFQVHEVKMPGGARTQLTFYPDDVRSAHYPPKGGDSFVFTKDIGGGEFYQLYRYDTATGAITLLTDGKSRNTDMVWSNSGKFLAYGSTRRTANDVDIWLSEPANPADAQT